MTEFPETSEDLFWDIEFPEGIVGSMGAAKPKAVLVYGEARRRLPIALSLARSLAKEQSSGFSPRTERELLAMVFEREEALAWTWLVRALNRRDLTTREADERLRREGFGSRSAKRTVDRAVELRYIDDLRYADTFASQRKAMGWGRRRIERELDRRGVRVAEIEGWAEGRFDPEDEAERAREVLARRSVPARNPYEKLVRFLVNRGFDYPVAKAAARERIDDDRKEA